MQPAARARRASLVALLLYAACAAADTGLHLAQPPVAGVARFALGRVIVATNAGLFWPVDLVAEALLARG
ncbi:MAG TPA: hypothetical protein VND87_03930 [Stellaceae bacterium]|nr:hypothetical protein [Stellaceae bacterium]